MLHMPELFTKLKSLKHCCWLLDSQRWEGWLPKGEPECCYQNKRLGSPSYQKQQVSGTLVRNSWLGFGSTILFFTCVFREGEREKGRILSRLHASVVPNSGLGLITLRSWPEPKSRVGGLTGWTTQAPQHNLILEHFFFSLKKPHTC